MKRRKAPPEVKLPTRYPVVDALRGTAIALMIAYHFCFDLQFYGWLHADFNGDPFWLGARATIVSLFLGVVGISLVLAGRNGLDWQRIGRRSAILCACAALASLSSYALFADSWIFFGILHFIAAASLLGLAFLRWHRLTLVIGLLLIGLGLGVELSFFDHPALQWFGLMTYKPITEDYVPLLPWFGVVLVGIYLGQWGLNQPVPRNAWIGAPLLSFAGRHSLPIYMLHQPLLLGMLYLLKRFLP